MRTRSPLGAAGLAALLLCGCEASSGPIVGQDPDTFRVTAATESLACTLSSCNIDIRGTARDDDDAFVSGAAVFTWVTTTSDATPSPGPTATTNGSGAYVLRLTFPATSGVTYTVRVCSGEEVRPADARCPAVSFGVA
jgi:hypothetical protein